MTIRIAIGKKSDDELKEISAKRKKDGELVKTKIGIIQELVSKAHKREVKQ